MAIDLHKEHYDENGVRKPLTVYPDVEAPEIYPRRKAAPLTVYPERDTPEIYPQGKAGAGDVKPAAAARGGLLSVLRNKKSIFAVVSVIAVIAVILISLPIMGNVTPEPEPQFSVRNSTEPQRLIRSETFGGDEIRSVNINSAGNTSLEFVYDAGDSGNITLMTNNGICPVTFTSDEGTLSVEYGGINANTPLTVVLPKGYDGKIQVKGKEDCDVTVNAGSDIDIYISSGEIKASGLKADCANFAVTEGNADISESELSILSIHVGTGKAAMSDCHIGTSLYTRIMKGSFAGRRIASDGTSSITAEYGELKDGTKFGGDIYCEDIRLSGETELDAYSSIRLYRADLGNAKINCDSRWSNVKVEASQPADIYRAVSVYTLDDSDVEYYQEGIYDLSIRTYGDYMPVVEFDCGQPAEPEINS